MRLGVMRTVKYTQLNHFAFYSHNADNKLEIFYPVSPTAGTGTGYVYDFSGRLLMSYDPYNGSYPPKKFYYDGINTLIEKEKFEDTCWRTVLANALKDAPIGQIITQMRWNYNTVPCGSPTFQSTMTAFHYDHIGNVLGTSI